VERLSERNTGGVVMIVRIANVRVPPERIDEMVSHYREILRPVHEQCEGLRNHYWLVNRQSGEVRIVGFWNSQEALETSKPTLDTARERYWESYKETPTLEAYEVADEI
jgi:quinol monooxygenase YgiN